MRARPMDGMTAAALGAVALLATLAPRPAPGAGLLVADGGFGGVLEIREHDVQVTINNGVAVTEVEQVFVNTEDRVVEALYTFPVPRGASVANFSMWIGGREMIGEVVEKQRARDIYNSYKQRRRDPGLLEQTDYKTFEMRIFPIGPGAEQRIRVAYYQELELDHDRATYVYPLATVTRRDIDQRTTGRFALSLDVRSAVPIVEMDSPSHADAMAIARHDDDYWQASLETRGGDLSRDVVVGFGTARPRTGLDLIASKTPDADGFLLLTLTAGAELREPADAADHVFVLDVSGSMGTDGKLSTSRGSLAAFVDQLTEQDRFEVIAFNVQPRPLFGELTAADADARARARDFLEAQEARGGTELPAALNAAFARADGDPDRTLNVVVLSDGLTEQRGRRELLGMMQRKPANARVFCIGVGNEVDRRMLEQLARDAGGLAAFISRGDDFERQAIAFRRKLTHPAATDVGIAFEGVEVYDLEPATLPALYHGTPIRIYGRYRGSGTATVTLNASVRGRAITTRAEVELPAADDANPEIERMWAWHRIDAMLKQPEAPKGTIAEIVRLGEAFSIACEHTSFIVLENDGEYRRWKIDRRNALRIKRDRAGQARVRAQLAAIRRRTGAALGPAPADAKAEPVQLARAADPVSAARSVPATATPGRARRGIDLDFGGGGGGGGALDPVSAAIVLGLGSFAVARRPRRPKG